jgi:leucyl/phenylalanyl-tRNA--protein transferase
VVAGDIADSKLIEAYGRSLFPFAHLGPLKWYSPAERCVLFFDEFHMAKNLRRQIRQGRHTVTFDRDFEGVVKACAGRRSGKWHVTWITPRIMHMFAGLFDAGHVHSFEVWNDAGELVGGGYGLALGSVFFTESQFSLERNTSKVGFSVLNWHLAKWGFTLNDGKFPTPTILDMQFRSIPRAELQTHLDRRKAETLKPGRWQVETDLATIAAWQPGGENADASKPTKQSKPKKEKAAVSATSPAASADIPAAVS